MAYFRYFSLVIETLARLARFAVFPKSYPLNDLRFLYEARLKTFAHAETQLMNDLDTKRLIDSRYLHGKLFDLEALARLPEGSLGREFSAFITGHALNQVYLKPLKYPKIDDTYNYVKKRTRETHDLHHVLLGAAPTQVGEMYVLTFLASQYHFPEAGIMMALALLMMVFKYPAQWDELMGAYVEAWQNGKRAKKFYGIEWEKYFELPVTEVREKFSIAAAKSCPITPAPKL